MWRAEEASNANIHTFIERIKTKKGTKDIIENLQKNFGSYNEGKNPAVRSRDNKCISDDKRSLFKNLISISKFQANGKMMNRKIVLCMQ